jgi:hypothetical protein
MLRIAVKSSSSSESIKLIISLLLFYAFIFSVLRVVNIVPFMPSFSVPFIGFGFDAVVVHFILLGYIRRL